MILTVVVIFEMNIAILTLQNYSKYRAWRKPLPIILLQVRIFNAKPSFALSDRCCKSMADKNLPENFAVPFFCVTFATANRPDGGIGRRAGLKHQWGNPSRFEPGSGYG